MNIFVVQLDPVKAAREVCDIHVLSQVKESAQMMCTVLRGLGAEVPYKPTPKNNPCTLWVGRTRSNFEWLVRHGLELGVEYRKRYPKRGVEHKSSEVIRQVMKYSYLVPEGDLTDFVLVMPEQYRIPGNPVESYRNFYKGEKRGFAAWRLRTPDWWTA